MRTISGYEGFYAVNSNSEIFNLKTGIKKKPSLSNCGYYVVDLFKNGERETLLVHRIVAKAFLDNKEFKPTVNHKDGNKLNNKVSNLEWATYSANHKHSYRELGRKAGMTGRYGALNAKSKRVAMCDKNNNLLKEYESIMSVERETGISNNSIVNCLKGRSETAGGYKWRYK